MAHRKVRGEAYTSTSFIVVMANQYYVDLPRLMVERQAIQLQLGLRSTHKHELSCFSARLWCKHQYSTLSKGCNVYPRADGAQPHTKIYSLLSYTTTCILYNITAAAYKVYSLAALWRGCMRYLEIIDMNASVSKD